MAALSLVPKPSSLMARLSEVDLIASTLEALDDAGITDGERDALSVLLIDAIQGTREKVDRTAAVLAEFEAAADAAKREMDRLCKRRESFARQHDRLCDYVLATLSASALKELCGNTATLKLRLNPVAVTIDDPEAVPAEFKRQPVPPPPPPAVPDKAAIKVALQSGVDVAGARLTRGSRLEVR